MARWLGRRLPGLPGEALPVAVLGTVLLIGYRYLSEPFFFTVVQRTFRGTELSYQEWRVIVAVALLLIAPLVLAAAFDRRGPRDLGLALGDARVGLKWTGIALAVMLPLVFAASFLDSFQLIYPQIGNARLILEALGYSLGIKACSMLAWEFFFRGYLLFGLHRWIGKSAVLVQMIPFVLLHEGKPLVEMLGAIPVGILLGVLALRTRSVLYCALVHFLIMAAMDVAAAAQRWWL